MKLAIPGLLVSVLLSGQAVNIRDFGAKGDGSADDTASIQAAFAAACERGVAVYFPATAAAYAIRATLTPACALRLYGDGPTVSAIFMTSQATGRHGIRTEHSLTIQDLAINTTPLTTDLGMAAVIRCDNTGPQCASGPAGGGVFVFERYASSGWNFGLDMAGRSETDLIESVTVKDCIISVGSSGGAVSEPVNVRSAKLLTLENSLLTGNNLNDHAVYLIGVRKVVMKNNRMLNHQNSAVKILTAEADTLQTYQDWTIADNTIDTAAIAIALYSYTTMVLPSMRIEGNRITNINSAYAGDAAAVYILAGDHSTIQNVDFSGNRLANLTLGGLVLITTATGTIDYFNASGNTLTNWSTAAPGTYYGFTTGGHGAFHRAAIAPLSSSGASQGRALVNMTFDRLDTSGK